MMNVVFDMETADPDDFLTLCFLATHPKVNLVGVTVTPGTHEQIGLVTTTLEKFGSSALIGSFDPDRLQGCVSSFHFKLDVWKDSTPMEPNDNGPHILARCLWKYPDLTLLTGGPLKNLHQFLVRYPDLKIKRWVGQGGFAGDSLVASEHRLEKFAGRETCPTFNFNGDVPGALLALGSNQIEERYLVSKNVCHATLYDKAFHEKYAAVRYFNLGSKEIYDTMEIYLRQHYKGKMLHDPLAACTMLNPGICEFKEVEVYRSKGEWGSRAVSGTNTFISVAFDKQKFENTLMYKDCQ